MFSDPLEFYEAIASELFEIIDLSWDRVEVEARRFDSSINLKVVYFLPDGSRKSDVDEVMLPEYFYELAKVVSNTDKGLYKKCSFVLKNTGEYDVNFEY